MTTEEITRQGYKPFENHGEYINKWRSCGECNSIRIGLYLLECSNSTQQVRVICEEPECRWKSGALRKTQNKNKVKFDRGEEWDALSREVRAERPFCEICLKEGKQTPTQVVHHIKPWHYYPELRFDKNNLQAVCLKHHEKYHPWLKKGQNK